VAPEDIKSEVRRRSLTADYLADIFVRQISEGGAQAVAIMEGIAKAQGKELSASDIESAYRAQIVPIENAKDQLTYTIGSIISGTAIGMLE